MQNTVRIILVLIFITLTGCATRPKHPAPTPSPDATKHSIVQSPLGHMEKISRMPHWEAQGRLAASKNSKGGNASFVWTQHGDHFQIKLFGPFGAGSVYITGNAQQVEIKEANGKKTKATSAEEALQKKAGWTVPLSGLHHWMVGLPIPGQTVQSQKVDLAGRLLVLNQKGWTVRYEGYSDTDGFSLPNKLKLQNGPVSVKIVINSWKPLSAP